MEKKNLLTSLKKLLGNLVGTEPEGNNLVEVIDSAAEGSDGKSPEPFVVTFSGVTADGNAACDKALSEIAEAYKSEKQIKGEYKTSRGKIYLMLNEVQITDGNPFYFSFCATWDSAPSSSEQGFAEKNCIYCSITDNRLIIDIYET